VPYPKIHYPACSFAPFISCEKAFHEGFSTYELSAGAFEPNNMLVGIDPWNGKFMACCMMYWGDVAPKDVNAAIATLKSKKTIQFVDWVKTGFKIGVNYSVPTVVPGGDLAKTMRSLLMLSNNTAMGEIIGWMNRKFEIMWNHPGRPFTCHYVGQGMEEGQF